MDSLTESQQRYIERVRKAHNLAGKDHKKVAEYIGVDRPTYTNYLKRRPMPQKYQAKFCKFTGINPNWLVTGEGEMKQILTKEERIDILLDDLQDTVGDVNKGLNQLIEGIRVSAKDTLK